MAAAIGPAAIRETALPVPCKDTARNPTAEGRHALEQREPSPAHLHRILQ